MPRLLHLAPATLEHRIRRSGLRGRSWTLPTTDGPQAYDEAIFAMPVTADIQVSHQWLRELRQWRGGVRMAAVVFRMDSAEPALFGRYGQPRRRGTLGEAVRGLMEDPWGSELVLHGPIPASAVVSIAVPRQDIGWTGGPGQHVDCTCPCCLPHGHPKLVRRLRARYHASIDQVRAGQKAGDATQIVAGLASMNVALERAGGRLSPARLLSLADHEDFGVRKALAWVLGYFSDPAAQDALGRLASDVDPRVMRGALESLLRSVGVTRTRALLGDHEPALIDLCDFLDLYDSEATRAVLRDLCQHPVDAVSREATRTLATVRG
jgi:hypothetical protein